MKSNILAAIILTLACLVFFSGIYTLTVFGIAQMAPNHGKGELIHSKGKIYYSNIGQSFTEDKYFYSRPSSVAYNAAGSCGSNKGPSNPDYLSDVRMRIDTFMAHNPGIQKADIPSELVTYSGSGLDPNISVKAAKVQVKRIAAIRKVSEIKILQLIEQNTEKPYLGMFGTEKINVLKLNISLDNLN